MFLKLWQSYLARQQASYLPSFGPTYHHLQNLKPLLIDLLSYEKNPVIRKYDKDKRWYQLKPEVIIPSYIKILGNELYIPTINRERKIIKIYVYSPRTTDKQIHNAIILSSKLDTSKAYRSTVITFTKPETSLSFSWNKIYFTSLESHKPNNPLQTNNLYQNLNPNLQATLGTLAKDPQMSGTAFLWSNCLTRKPYPDIYTVSKNKQIVGLIGPIEYYRDFWGRKTLAPMYFEVSPKHRGQKLGSQLWQQAMDSASQHNAKYHILQALVDEPSDMFYQKQNFVHLGDVFTIKIYP